jgi:hypothetical protein
MADLSSDNVTLGLFVRALAKNRKRCDELAKSDDLATQEFGNLLTIPDGHKIRVHLDEENVTHVIIPLQKDIEDAEKQVTSTKRGYPSSYVPDPLVDFIASENPMKALTFRIGEYTMRRCKG